MRTRLILLVAFAALAMPAAALAKGASEATVTGPGLDKPLYFGGGESQGTPVMNLVMNAGFFEAAFGREPNPILDKRPSGSLGPKYVIHYVVPTGNGGDNIDQDVYPYAKSSPVTYMKAGQKLFDQQTRGGWYVAPSALKQLLVGAGLPRTAPRVAKASHHATAWIVGGAVAAAGAIGLGWWRRK